MKTNMIKYGIPDGRAVFIGDKAECYSKMKKIDSDITLIEDIEIPDGMSGEELLNFAWSLNS